MSDAEDTKADPQSKEEPTSGEEETIATPVVEEKKDSETASPEPTEDAKPVEAEKMEAAAADGGGNETTEVTEQEEEEEEEEDLFTLQKKAEEKAIAEATASADASFTPSPTLMADPSPLPLLKSVDGPSLTKDSQSPSVFMARSVPIPLRGKLDIPIHVTSGGSIVEYSLESESYDISFGIIAEREEGITVVAENSRIDTHIEAVTGKFLVGTVPCALIFTFDNEYSWFREKKISYCITITPPSKDNIIAGRRRRAKSALGVVLEDKSGAEKRLERTSVKRSGLAEEVERLEKELEEKKKSLGVTEKEEDWLQTRVDLRNEQETALKMRLEKGWDDEVKNESSTEEQTETEGESAEDNTNDEDRAEV